MRQVPPPLPPPPPHYPFDDNIPFQLLLLLMYPGSIVTDTISSNAFVDDKPGIVTQNENQATEYFCVHSIRVNFACLFVWYTRHFHSAQRRTAGFGSQGGRDGAGRSSVGCSSAIDCSPPHFRRASQHRCHLSPITPYQMATLLHY